MVSVNTNIETKYMQQNTIKKGPGRPALGEPTKLKNFRIRMSLVERMNDEPNATALINQLIQKHYDAMENKK